MGSNASHGERVVTGMFVIALSTIAAVILLVILAGLYGLVVENPDKTILTVAGLMVLTILSYGVGTVIDRRDY